MKILNKIKTIPTCNLFFILLLNPFLRLFLYRQYDNDFWFTINQGRYILQNGFPFKAINIIHNFDFVYQSYGTGIIFYLIYNYFKQYGMILLLIIISTLTAFFYYKLCNVISNNKRKSIIITIIAMTFYNSLYLTTRPHIFTTLNIAILLYLLEGYFKTENKKYLYFLPFITLLEVNMHGIYFIILLVLTIPYLINTFKFKFLGFESLGFKKKELFITYIFMILSGFINPYGYKTIIYGFSSYSSKSIMNNFINELLAPDFHFLDGKLVIISVITLICIAFVNRKKIPIRNFLLIMGTAYLALDSLKSFNIFIICSLFYLVYVLKLDIKEMKYSKYYFIFHLMLTISLAIFMLINAFKINISKSQIELYNYLDSIVENKQDLKMYTDFYNGSYAEYRGYYCYIDPRAEIFLKSNNHKEDILEEYFNLKNLEINYKDFLNKYKFDYLIIQKDEDYLHKLLLFDSCNYEIIYENENYLLYKLN